jgi:hypothetical protein
MRVELLRVIPNGTMARRAIPMETGIVMTEMSVPRTFPRKKRITSPVRRTAIKEAARVLKLNGYFVLVDWTRPERFISRVWCFQLSPYVRGEKARDNWFNTYPDLCKGENLLLETDRFISPYVRCQCFVKKA